MKIFIRHLVVLALCFLMHDTFAQGSITGTVLDESAAGIPGATIIVKGTSNGTVSDIEGNFTIQASPEDVLLISFVGYLTQEVPVGGQTTITVNMEMDVEQLDEVVVVGYGTMKKRDVTGAIATVDSEDIANVRSANAIESIQGRVAGVDITRSSGRAGSGYNISVRGTRSLTGGNDPLYIVDGIQFGTDNVNIDPNDIESVEILKDASSTAIYGSQGANGVVIITTKKGKEGKSTLSFNSYVGVTEGIGSVPLGDAAFFKQMYNDFAWMKDWQNDPQALPSPNGYKTELRENENENVDYDWYDGLLRKGMQQNYNLSFTGGGKNLVYSTSLSYFKEDGMIKNDNYERVTFRLNLEGKISDHLSIGASSLISFVNQQDRINPLGDARKLSPLSVPFDSAGNIIPFPRYREEVRNPFITEDEDYFLNETRSTRSFTTFFAKFSMLDGALTYRPSVNLDIKNKRRGEFEGIYPGIGGISRAYANNLNELDYTIQNVLNYAKDFGQHAVNVTVGSEIISRRDEEYGVQVQELGKPNSQWYAISSGTQNLQFLLDDPENYPNQLRQKKLASFFGRVHYSFAGKYMVQFSGRYDGASQLAEGNKWSFFPSVSAAWNIAEESFLQGQSTVSDLKLRASFGVAGNQGVQAFAARGATTANPLYYQFGVAESQSNGYRTDQNENLNLGWENTTSINIGLDYGFFGGRLNGSLEVYQTDTEDLLQQVSLSPHSGITSIVANVGSTQNKGIELALNATIIDNGSLRWKLGGNFYKNDEKITALASGVQQDLLNGWFVGQPTEVYYDRKFVGIWQTSETAQAAEYGLTPGDIKFADLNSDTLYSDDDRQILGTPRPKWTMGLNTSVEYKGFDFTVLAYVRWGHMIRDEVLSSFSPDGLANSMEHDYWTPFNPSNTYPRLDPRKTQSGYSDLNALEYRDGSFFKIRDITLGYTLPKGVIQKAGMSSMRVYVTVKNAFIFGDYYDGGNRYDPELLGDIELPMPRLFAGGLNVTF